MILTKKSIKVLPQTSLAGLRCEKMKEPLKNEKSV